VLSGELGLSQAFLARWYIGGGYMDVSKVVVFYDYGKIWLLSQTNELAAVITLSTNNSRINEHKVDAAFLSLEVHGS